LNGAKIWEVVDVHDNQGPHRVGPWYYASRQEAGEAASGYNCPNGHPLAGSDIKLSYRPVPLAAELVKVLCDLQTGSRLSYISPADWKHPDNPKRKLPYCLRPYCLSKRETKLCNDLVGFGLAEMAGSKQWHHLAHRYRITQFGRRVAQLSNEPI
jgi:hypothetical protein